MKFTNALVVKLVDTNDLKAKGYKYRNPKQFKHHIKSYIFNLDLN